MNPISDEDLKKITIGERKPHNSVITLSDYNSDWQHIFEFEHKRIKKVLGDRALIVEHVGSTAVPGLAAKPIIDILLIVANSADEASYVPDLEKIGFVLRIRESSWFEHRLLKGPNFPVNLHVFSQGALEIERMIMFRDHLRTHEPDKELYLQTKRSLAKKKWKYIQNYADSKSDIIE